MIFLYIVIAALALSLAVKRAVWNPLDTDFKWFYLVFLPFALELFVVLVSPGNFSGYITSIAYIIVAFFSIINWRIPGFLFIMAGTLSNAFVVIINGGKMPVLQQTLVLAGLPADMMDAKHVALGANTVLPFLSDVIPINFLNLHYACSVGDLLVYTGLFLLVYLNAKKKPVTEKSKGR